MVSYQLVSLIPTSQVNEIPGFHRERVQIKNIQENRTVDVDDVDYVSDIIANKNSEFTLKNGDLLMAMTGATVGKFGLIVNKKELCLLNQRVARFIPNVGKNPWFIYCALLNDIFLNQIIERAEGSAQPNVSAGCIKSAKLSVPPDQLIKHFILKVDSLFQNIIQNVQESRTLASLRDTLLPRLLSGELSFNELNAAAS